MQSGLVVITVHINVRWGGHCMVEVQNWKSILLIWNMIIDDIFR